MRSLIGAVLVMALATLGKSSVFAKSRIKIKSAEASSVLKDKKNRYVAKHAFDGSAKKVWSEGVEGDGIGETLTVELNEAQEIVALSVSNGHSSKKYFKKNNRIKELKVTADGKHSATLALKDERTFQIVKLPSKFVGKKIVFEIISVYSGTKWKDTVISEIMLLDSKSLAKLQKKYKKSRKKAAKKLLHGSWANEDNSRTIDFYSGGDCEATGFGPGEGDTCTWGLQEFQGNYGVEFDMKGTVANEMWLEGDRLMYMSETFTKQ